MQNPTHKEIIFCYVSQIFAYFILPHVVLYFIFSRRFLVIIVSHRTHKDAHLICLNFVSCHVHYYLFYFNAPADYYILMFGTKTLAARGLEELFFQLCCRVSFWFWQEIGFGLHTFVLRVPYSCGVVSVFLLLVG